MAGNSYGSLFRLSTFGESHGAAIGGTLDGCPPGVSIDLDRIQSELDRRRPGQSKITTQRKEADTVEFLSGLFEGKTQGTPIGFVIRNGDSRSKDYDHLKEVFRPSHADATYAAKYGTRDHRGGGRSSARETACRVVGGAIARQLLEQQNIECFAYVSQVSHILLEKGFHEVKPEDIDQNIVRCPDQETALAMIELIDSVRKDGDTVGGIVTCVIKNLPSGLGEPVFDKFNADLAKAMFSINAVKGMEIGSGFSAVEMRGSEHNDVSDDHGQLRSNFSGGIQGGITNGETVYFNVAFKPVATIMKDQLGQNQDGEAAVVKGKGRHDPCVVPRAVPIVEAMALMTIADHFLRQKSNL